MAHLIENIQRLGLGRHQTVPLSPEELDVGLDKELRQQHTLLGARHGDHPLPFAGHLVLGGDVDLGS